MGEGDAAATGPNGEHTGALKLPALSPWSLQSLPTPSMPPKYPTQGPLLPEPLQPQCQQPGLRKGLLSAPGPPGQQPLGLTSVPALEDALRDQALAEVLQCRLALRGHAGCKRTQG